MADNTTTNATESNEIKAHNHQQVASKEENRSIATQPRVHQRAKVSPNPDEKTSPCILSRRAVLPYEKPISIRKLDICYATFHGTPSTPFAEAAALPRLLLLLSLQVLVCRKRKDTTDQQDGVETDAHGGGIRCCGGRTRGIVDLGLGVALLSCR